MGDVVYVDSVQTFDALAEISVSSFGGGPEVLRNGDNDGHLKLISDGIRYTLAILPLIVKTFSCLVFLKCWNVV